MEHIYMEAMETHKEKIPIWKLCYVVSQGRKYTYGQILEKMVWHI